MKGISTEATVTPFGVLFPQQVPVPDPQTYPTALLEGKLVVVERCLRVIASEGGTSHLLVWPPDFSLSIDQGTLIVLNGAGQALYRQGDTVSIAGGEVPPDEASWLNTPLLRQRPPKECPGPYWLASPLVQPTLSAHKSVATTAAIGQPTMSIPMPAQPTPDHPFAGGTISNGPFTFTLFLYKDDSLSPATTIGPWAYSDLPGVGVYMDWVYHGPPLEGPVDWLCGTEQDLSPSCGGRYDHLEDGYHGGRAGGGILLPGGYLPGSSHVGDVVRWIT